MPRTKLNRNGAKRNRNSSNDEKLQIQLKDLDALAHAFSCDIDLKCMQYTEELTELIDMLRKKTPKAIMKMTFGELEAMEIKNFADMKITYDNTNSTICSATSLSVIMEKSVVTKKFSYDEGYLTEDGSRTSSENPSTKSVLRTGRALGPLASAKQRRRSKSAGGYLAYTPAGPPSKNTSVLGKKKQQAQTPQPQERSLGEHASRPKYRTPMRNHIKSASADRLGTITPKVQPYHPMAMLRHAKAGEAIFSMSGSPVVTSSITEETANVNIPISNGVLSIRPTEMQSVDAQFVSRLGSNTISQLQQLKDNLDLILRANKY